MFERLRAAIHAALGAAGASSDPRAIISQMRDAVIEARAALEGLREGIRATQSRLAVERRQLEDAERRGRLAAGIQDQETVAVAAAFAARHRERVSVLEEKLAAQRHELELAEREYEEMKAQLFAAERSRPVADAARSAEAAWRSVEAAGGVRPGVDPEGERLGAEIDRAARDAQVDSQLEALKRRMGRA